MKKKIMVYVALMAIGLYVMPNTVSIFAGQHTFYNGMGVACDKCHTDVLSQVEAGGYVYEKHRAAAGNTNYTTYLSVGGTDYSPGSITAYDGKIWTWNGNEWQNGSDSRNVSLDKNGNGGIDGTEICMLCHNATLFNASTHTGVVIKVCDDDRCHGNRNAFYNRPALFGQNSANVTAAGYNLSQTNVHQAFYLQAGNLSSSYEADTPFGQPGNSNGLYISRGHWACEGCHTEIIVNVTIAPASAYNHSVGSPDAPTRYN